MQHILIVIRNQQTRLLHLLQTQTHVLYYSRTVSIHQDMPLAIHHAHLSSTLQMVGIMLLLPD